MNWTDLATAVPILAALGGGAKFYADNTYVLVAESLEGQLFQLQRDIKRMELDDDLDEKEEAYLEFLRLQAEQLESKIN